VNFDRVAPFYEALETIAYGHALQRARIRWLRAIPSPGRALILGEGNGRFVSELLKAHPGVKIDCVDASAAMLKLVKRRLGEASGVGSGMRFLQRDIREWTPVDSYDLIVTHFVLDCFEASEVKVVVEKLARVATRDATWLLADFTVPQSALARMQAKVWLRAMYFFFRVTAGLRTSELIDPTGDLSAQGFARRSREVSRLGMLKSEMWSRR
jgi:ubiquinone/menaquinone biosynthesis C-methylase UbiE